MNQGKIWQLLLWLVYFCAVWFILTRPSVKCLEQTPNKLVFRVRPTFGWGCGVFFGGAGLILLVDRTHLYISGFFFFLSLLIIALSSVKTCTFDKERSRMTIKRQHWFGEKILEHSINEISDVQIEHTSSSEGSRIYRVTLILSSGEKLPLTRSYTSGIEEKQYIANLIKYFLNLGRFKPKEQTATG